MDSTLERLLSKVVVLGTSAKLEWDEAFLVWRMRWTDHDGNAHEGVASEATLAVIEALEHAG